MKDLSFKNIIKAADILAENSSSKVAFDKTIEATIEEVKNENTGEYRVEYESNIFSAYSLNTAIKYKLKDRVQIKIPNGDFSNQKIIEGKVQRRKDEDNDQLVKYEIKEFDPNWFSKEYYQLIEYNSENYCYKYNKNGEYELLNNSKAEFPLLINYNKYYNLIQLKASFTTSLEKGCSQGDYGIKITYLNQEGKEKIESFNLSNFHGNPYKFSDFYSEQSVIIDLGLEQFKSLKSVIFYIEGFKNFDNNEEYYIAVKDLNINYVEIIDYTKEKYYLSIFAPEGTSFVGSVSTSLPLIANLYSYGEDILKKENCKCYWYEEDLSLIAVDSNNHGGQRWKEIKDTDFNRLTVFQDNFKIDQKYKVVVIYNGKYIFEKEILIEFKDAQVEIKMAPDEKFLVLDNNGKTEYNKIVGDWYILDGTYNYEKYSNFETNKVEKQNAYNGFIIYYCAVHFPGDNKILTNLQYYEEKNDGFFKADFIGSKVFHYNINGECTNYNFKDIQTLDVKLNFPYLKKEWYLGDISLSSKELEINNSMIQSIWTDKDDIVHYLIKPDFHYNYNKNIITLKVMSQSGQIYNFSEEIFFIQDGSQGTNGTEYVCIIQPYDDINKRKIVDFSPLKFGKNEVSSLVLKAFIYKNGELINYDTNENYDIAYEWKSLEVNKDNALFNIFSNKDKCSLSGIGSNFEKIVNNTYDYNQFYSSVILTVLITDKSNSNQSGYIKIINEYPVILSYNIKDSDDLKIDIPNAVRYSFTGNQPQFSSYQLQLELNKKNELSHLESKNLSLIKINKSIEQSEYFLHPSNYYSGDDVGNGVLKYTSEDSSKIIIYPIILYLNTYGNQTINDWGGSSIRIDPNGESILAPWVGAGIKHLDNTFSGVTIGALQNIDVKDDEEVGLFGYNHGKASFAFKRDGTAFIGEAGKGRINFDGTSAIIHGGMEEKNGKNSMILKLTNLRSDGKGDPNVEAIKVQGTNETDKFIVKYDGSLISTSGEIGGWKITNEYLTNESNTIVLNSKNSNENISLPFNVLEIKDGNFTKLKIDSMGNMVINGRITWSSNSSPSQCLYSNTGAGKPEDGTTLNQYQDNGISIIDGKRYEWHKIFNPAKINKETPSAGGDSFASYTFDGGLTWGYPIKVRAVDGEKGEPGLPGKDADLNNVVDLFAKNGIDITYQGTQSTETAVYSPLVGGGEFYALGAIQRDPVTHLPITDNLSYLKVDNNGLCLMGNENGIPKNLVKIGYIDDRTTGDWDTPYIILGQGESGNGISPNSVRIQKYGYGLWIGNNAVNWANGNEPFLNAGTIDNQHAVIGTGFGKTFSTGFWFDFEQQQIYCYGKDYKSFKLNNNNIAVFA